MIKWLNKIISKMKGKNYSTTLNFKTEEFENRYSALSAQIPRFMLEYTPIYYDTLPKIPKTDFREACEEGGLGVYKFTFTDSALKQNIYTYIIIAVSGNSISIEMKGIDNITISYTTLSRQEFFSKYEEAMLLNKSEVEMDVADSMIFDMISLSDGNTEYLNHYVFTTSDPDNDRYIKLDSTKLHKSLLDEIPLGVVSKCIVLDEVLDIF